MEILKLNNIHKAFGSNNIHNGVCLKLKENSKLGLLGSSGTGKSVLLRSIIGLEYIDQGKIFFKGKRIDNLSEKEMSKIRTQISYAFQSGALFDSMNVFENLAFPLFEHTDYTLKEIQEKVEEILELVDLCDSIYKMPSDLSGGMQKRVGMARSMILNPDIVLYDEPTAGLDPTNTVNVVNVMKKFSQRGVTSIFVTHDIPSAIEFCDRIIILDKGKIVFDGTTHDFSTSDSDIVKKFLITEGFQNASTSS